MFFRYGKEEQDVGFYHTQSLTGMRGFEFEEVICVFEDSVSSPGEMQHYC